jgi:hypothetical protein
MFDIAFVLACCALRCYAARAAMSWGGLTIIGSHRECKDEALMRHALELRMREAANALGSTERLLDDYAPAPAHGLARMLGGTFIKC